MPSDLRKFELAGMLRCSTGLRKAALGARSVEDVAQRVCAFLRDQFVNDPGAGVASGRQCALVRMYVTHPYGGLDRELRRFADKLLGEVEPTSAMRCLCLMGTVGERTEWNDRRASRSHRAIPLPSPQIVERAPMVAQLIRQFGLDLQQVIAPTPELMAELTGRTYGVFHVEEAGGSPYIPAQDFVRENGIRSVVGFGGSLRTGDIFAVLLFTTVPVSPYAADRFRTIALDVKTALFQVGDHAVFDPA